MNAMPASPRPDAKTSGQAVWSLVFGILSLLCLWILGSIPAIILGILAIKKVDQSGGTLKGKGLGIAGIVTGGIGLVTGFIQWAAILASLAIPAFSQVQHQANLAKQSNDVHQLLIACRQYAADNEGKYPPDLAALVTDGYLDSDRLLTSKVQSSGGIFPLPYLYRPGLTDSSPGNEPLIAAPEPMGQKRVVGYVDVHVETVPEAEFQATIRQQFEGAP